MTKQTPLKPNKEIIFNFLQKYPDVIGKDLSEVIDKCVEETRKEIENKVKKLEEWVEIPNRGVVQEDGGPFIFKIDVLKLLTTPKP